jgi:hypothetical protein
MESEPATTTPAFQSKLPGSRERFVSEVVAMSLELGERAAADFLRQFPPRVMMEGLAGEPTLRAQILCAATGTKLKIGVKKSVASASEDLEIALREGEAQPEDVLSAFLPDDRVRFLPPAELWTFMSGDQFWVRSPKDGQGYDRARALITYVLDRALAHGLLTHEQVVAPITAKTIRSTVSADDLWDVVHAALASSAKFSHRSFVDAMPVDTLTRHVALADLWEKIIAPEVAQKEGLLPRPEPPASAPPPAPAEAEPAPVAAPAEAEPAPAAAPAEAEPTPVAAAAESKPASVPPPAEAAPPSAPAHTEVKSPSMRPPPAAKPRPPSVRPSRGVKMPVVRPPPAAKVPARVQAATKPRKTAEPLPVSDAELVPDDEADDAMNVAAEELLDAVDEDD